MPGSELAGEWRPKAKGEGKEREEDEEGSEALDGGWLLWS